VQGLPDSGLEVRRNFRNGSSWAVTTHRRRQQVCLRKRTYKRGGARCSPRRHPAGQQPPGPSRRCDVPASTCSVSSKHGRVKIEPLVAGSVSRISQDAFHQPGLKARGTRARAKRVRGGLSGSACAPINAGSPIVVFPGQFSGRVSAEGGVDFVGASGPIFGSRTRHWGPNRPSRPADPRPRFRLRRMGPDGPLVPVGMQGRSVADATPRSVPSARAQDLRSTTVIMVALLDVADAAFSGNRKGMGEPSGRVQWLRLTPDFVFATWPRSGTLPQFTYW
jgi:hypothetical protein